MSGGLESCDPRPLLSCDCTCVLGWSRLTNYFFVRTIYLPEHTISSIKTPVIFIIQMQTDERENLMSFYRGKEIPSRLAWDVTDDSLGYPTVK